VNCGGVFERAAGDDGDGAGEDVEVAGEVGVCAGEGERAVSVFGEEAELLIAIAGEVIVGVDEGAVEESGAGGDGDGCAGVADGERGVDFAECDFSAGGRREFEGCGGADVAEND